MLPVLNDRLKVGEIVPDCTLPDGSNLAGHRDKPLILAFAPEEWNPSHAYQSELFSQLCTEFGQGAAFVEASPSAWHSLDAAGDLAAQWGVAGQRALFLIDEKGFLRWKVEVRNGETISSGEVIAALENLRSPSPAEGQLSRRAFLSATLAAAALLTLPRTSGQAAPAPKTTPAQRFEPGRDALHGTVPVTLKVNGKTKKLQLEPRVALLDALRENLHLTGTKKGCDHGQCGACTVHIDGERALSCLTLAVMNEGKSITTIEGLAQGETLHPVQAAFIKHDAFQCGYCTPGQIMSAVALLKENRAHSEAEIREAMSGNLCRCAAYPNIIAAVKEARGT